jgi:hypothetical protein
MAAATLAALGGMAAGAAHGQVRIVDAAAQVQSVKRGVSANFLNASDFTALSPGVSWWYNWAPTPNQSIPGNANMEFIPMAWNGTSGSLDSLSNYLADANAAGNLPRQVLAINEPNLEGQATMTPAQAATVYKNVKAIAAPYGVPVSGPQMAVNGTMTMQSFLTQFFQQAAGNNTTVDSIGFHAYDNRGGFEYWLGEAQQQFAGPIWVTEFAWWDAPTVAAARDHMIKTVDLMERSSHVEAYAWFKERNSSATPHISLLASEPGVLTSLGQTYVNMPVHDPDLYYRPNGRLQAERYVTMIDQVIGATGDAAGLADMVSSANGAQLNYNLFVDQPGLYEVSLRVAGEWGNVTLLDGTETLGSVWMEAGGWRTLVTQVQLDAGYESLSLQFQRPGQVINWLEFRSLVTPVPEPGTAGLFSLISTIVLLARRNRAPVMS